MVRIKLILPILMAWLFMAVSLGAWAVERPAKIYPKTLMLGEHLTLTLYGKEAIDQFDLLNLNELKQNFAIADMEASSDRLRLRLYPRTTGVVILPELMADNVIVPATPITVHENLDVQISWQPPKLKQYVAESLFWKATVSLNEPSSTAYFEATESSKEQALWQAQLNQPSSNLTSPEPNKILLASYQFIGPYPTFSESDYLDVKQTTGTFTTQNLTDNSTQKSMPSPVVVVTNRTNRPWRFYAQPSKLTFKPLPQFLPANIPVGPIQFEAVHPGMIQTTGDLNHWVWKLTGLGVNEAALQQLANQLLQQIRVSEQIQWLTESRVLKTQLTEQGLQTQLTVRLPYRMNQAGLLDLPALNAKVFDPESGKLTNQIVASNTLISMPSWLVWIAWVLVILASVGLVMGGLATLYRVWVNWQNRQAIYYADSIESLIQALLTWQYTQQAHPKNPYSHLLTLYDRCWPLKVPTERINKFSRPGTLQGFQEWVEQRYGQSPVLTELIATLNQVLYAQNPATSQTPLDPKISKLAKIWVKSGSLWR